MSSIWVKGFVVVQEMKNGRITTYKRVSRQYHVREAAEEFKLLAEKSDPDVVFHVHEVVGTE